MIRFEGLSHDVEPGEQALCEIDFEIGHGENVVLLGANGSGKSTLLKIINGLVFPTEGHYHYDGEIVTAQRLKDGTFNRRFRQEVGLLFQNPDAMLFNPTVFDEIAFGLRQLLSKEDTAIDDRVHHWARVVGVEAFLDKPPFKLSGGEKQKVCLAALLVLEPWVLLLDEPTASLDPRSTGWLVDLLQELAITTIVTTHNLSMAPELGERALVLGEDHRLLYDGPIGAFLEDRERLVAANLVHSHRHRHGDTTHRHFHIHDWE